eukprot:TRINITY_DN7164_c0_g1_i13.p2 TRINITY_DN7164_c0_g1~~TRINITY_DN7164_c0_g1_i13.p2  ORF type:complete len:140 (-),score=2.40 TRINITY_DN7164_c0_g1_i13:17-436(-)
MISLTKLFKEHQELKRSQVPLNRHKYLSDLQSMSCFVPTLREQPAPNDEVRLGSISLCILALSRKASKSRNLSIRAKLAKITKILANNVGRSKNRGFSRHNRGLWSRRNLQDLILENSLVPGLNSRCPLLASCVWSLKQ